MALNNQAVITAAQGFVFIAPVGTAHPTPSALDTLDPKQFGSQVQTVKVTGTPTSYTLEVDGEETAALAAAATAAQVQAALEALATVGAGNVAVTGVSAADTDGLTVTWVGTLQGVALEVDEGTFVGGSTPAYVILQTVAPNGWQSLGHTSREDMPEFGFEGGETEVRGTWQEERLREVASGDPVADFVTLNLQQWDARALEMYFGTNVSATPGVYAVSGNFDPVEYAFLVVIIDGSARIGFHSVKASIRRDDSIELPVDEFASLPVRATFLNLGTNPLYSWLLPDLV